MCKLFYRYNNNNNINPNQDWNVNIYLKEKKMLTYKQWKLTSRCLCYEALFCSTHSIYSYQSDLKKTFFFVLNSVFFSIFNSFHSNRYAQLFKKKITNKTHTQFNDILHKLTVKIGTSFLNWCFTQWLDFFLSILLNEIFFIQNIKKKRLR